MSKTLRFKCPKCGTVQDVSGNGPCWKCHVMISLPEDGVIWIRRMDDLIFSGGRFRHLTEVYLNGIFLNWLSNNEFIRIPVPYGHYNVLLKHPDRRKVPVNLTFKSKLSFAQTIIRFFK